MQKKNARKHKTDTHTLHIPTHRHSNSSEETSYQEDNMKYFFYEKSLSKELEQTEGYNETKNSILIGIFFINYWATIFSDSCQMMASQKPLEQKVDNDQHTNL